MDGSLARDYSHPCAVTWVPFNESWGVPNLPDSPDERHYVQALYHLTKTLDPTRPVIGNDGWESVSTDIIGIHDYDSQPDRIARRYLGQEILPRFFRRERPGGRLFVLGEQTPTEQPIVLSEFGGIACSDDPGTWGYSRCSAEQLAGQYTRLLETVRSLAALSGFCYTQFADTFQEANGLLRANREPKFPLADIARATRGHDSPRRRSNPSPPSACLLRSTHEQARVAKAGRPASYSVRPRSDSRRPARALAFIGAVCTECAPAVASASGRVGRLCEPSPASDVHAPACLQPAGADS